MQELEIEGKLMKRPLTRWIAECGNMEVIRFILNKTGVGDCPVMVLCFDNWSSDFLKNITTNEHLKIAGHLRGFAFHDVDNTLHYMNYVVATSIITEDGQSAVVDDLEGNIEMEESCLRIMKEKDYLPVPQDEYEIIIESVGDNIW